MENFELLMLLGLSILIILQLINMFVRKPSTGHQDLSAIESSQDLHSAKIISNMSSGFSQTRIENNNRLDGFEMKQLGQLDKINGEIQRQLKGLTDSNEHKFDALRDSMFKAMSDIRLNLNARLETIQEDNHKQLEKMRETVDEKLHKTLEERLGKSFELVSKQLIEVQKGLGEMQELANGVGDLKKVLSNVKTRGVMGEIQLGNILEQLMSPDQYSLNVSTIPGSRNHVEFAIKLPGRDKDLKEVWLPIDSKFPMDRYLQLHDAYEDGDKDLIAEAKKELVKTIKVMAKDIKDKYIEPPYTTDFGILFLPTEGLYAEVVRQPELIQVLQRDYKIIVAGPTNLAALLNSLQMGFRSLAIEKRSSEVWKILGTVKTEFGKFGGVLEKVQRKLTEASNTIDKVGIRTRAIERNLRDVEALPDPKQNNELPFDDGVDMEDFVELN